MWFAIKGAPERPGELELPRRGLVTGAALTLLLAGSLAFTAPAFAQDTDTDEETAEATVTAAADAEGEAEADTDAAAGDTDADADAAAGEEGAEAETTVAADAATTPAAGTTAAPAAGGTTAPAASSGAAAPTTLPNTGVGDVETVPLSLIVLAAAGAVAAGTISVNQARPATCRVRRRV